MNQKHRYRPGTMAIAFCAAAFASPQAPAAPVFPLKASANGRYLVDQNNLPFQMIGDSPQAMIGNLSEDDAATFIANFSDIGGFANSGKQRFTPPGKNSAGDEDWLLLIEQVRGAYGPSTL
jgi:hypothetical protein